MNTPSFVIVGASLAGAKAARALRDNGFDGSLTLIGDELWYPYERPPLSKDYLQGKVDRDTVFVHPPRWYTAHEVDLRLDTTATAIDRGNHLLTLGNGEQLPYDKLLLTTGASPRRLPLPGADAHGVYYLRSLDDSNRLRELLHTASRIALVGGGWIGLEVAAAARAAGVEVTVVERSPLPLQAVLGPDIAAVFADLHRDHGANLHLAATLAEITTCDGAATGLRLADGSRIDADAVIVGIGATPNTGLAGDSGLDVDNGIVVDPALRSSDPDIFAAGDVANAYHPFYSRHIRVEHWANALHQPDTAAATMLGRDASYQRLPYFYTDQYELGMEYTGYCEPDQHYQVVVRGDLQERRFIAFWLRDDRVAAGMNVNIWDVTEPIQTLIRTRTVVDPARLADPDVPLTDLTTPASSRTERDMN